MLFGRPILVHVLRYTASAAEHPSPSVSVQIRPPVLGVVSPPSTGLYGNATVAGIPSHLLSRLQSVMNAAARLIFSSSRFEHITPLLRYTCSSTGWSIQIELLSSVPSSYIYASTGLHRRTSSMNCVKWRTSRLASDSVLPRLHHWSSAALDYSSHQEQFTPARHFCTFVACLPVTPQTHLFTISYPSPRPYHVGLQWLRSDTCH